MNEATKQALEQFVTKMLAAAEAGASWTADQAPLLVQEWLQWQFFSSVLIGAALLIGATVVLVFTVKMCRIKDWDDYLPLQVITAIVSVVMFFAAGEKALAAVKVYVAPRVVVLEKFADLIK